MSRSSIRRFASLAAIMLGVFAAAQPALAAKATTVTGVIVAQTSSKAVVVARPNGHLLRVVLFRAASNVVGRRLKVTGLIDGLGIMTALSSKLVGGHVATAPFSGTLIANDVGIDYLADQGVVLPLHTGTRHAPGLLLTGVLTISGTRLSERSARTWGLGGSLNISGIVSVLASDGVALRLAGGANVWVGFAPKTVVDISALWLGASAILKAQVGGTIAKPVLLFTNDAVLTGARMIKSVHKYETQGSVKSISGQRIAVAPLGGSPLEMVVGAGVSVDGIGTDDTVLVDAHSEAGNLVADHIVLVARAVPAVPAQATWTSTPPANTTARSATFDWSMNVKADLVVCYLDLDTFNPCAAPFVTGQLQPGQHTFSVYARNAKGYTTTTIHWTVDDPIQVQLVSSPTLSTTATTATFVYKVTGNISTTGFQCVLSDGTPNQFPFVPCTPTLVPGTTDQWQVAYSGLSVAKHSASLKAVNSTNSANSGLYIWTIAPPTPVVSVTVPAAGVLTSGTVLFSATNTPTSYTCSIDAAPAADCSAVGGALAFSGLAVGAHTVTVKATNSGGTGTGTGSWTISAPPVPIVTLPGAPSGTVVTTSATIYWYASGNAASETCAIDGAAATPCPGPIATGALSAGTVSLTSLSPGTHTVVVTATNSSGSGSGTAAWTVAATPVVTITSSPATGSATTGTVLFTATNTPTSITCQLDAATPVACAGLFNLSGLALGSHTVTVAATNLAGTGTRTTSAWTVSTPTAGAPAVTFNTVPIGPVAPPTPGITWTATNTPTTTTCKFDGGTASNCTSPFVPGSGRDTLGVHTLLVTATNASGSGTATVAWIVTAVPTVSISSPVDGSTTAATNATVTFTTGNSPTTVTCTIDGGAAAACTSPVALSGLAIGQHSARVDVSNASGSAFASVSWTVAGPSPIVTLVSPPSGSTTATSATINWTATNSPTSTTCKLDANAAVACTQAAGFATGTLAIGAHSVVVTATNSNGSGAATATWTVTPAAPTVTLTTNAAGFPPLTNATPSATFTWTSGGGAAATTTCQLDGAAAVNCASPTSYTSLASGTHSFSVTLTNTGGAATATYTWAVVAGAVPTVSFTQAPPSSTTSTTATIAWATTNGPTTDTCTLDNVAYTPCTAAAVNLSGLAVGNHSFIVVAANASGSGTATASWTISPNTGGTPPTNSVLPTLSGSASSQTTWKPRSGTAGTTGYILNGTWSGATTYTYQWYTCSSTTLATCTVISGATTNSYHATAADIDRYLIGSVIASNAGGSTTAYTTASSKTQPS